MGLGKIFDNPAFKRRGCFEENDSVSRRLCFKLLFWTHAVSSKIDNDYNTNYCKNLVCSDVDEMYDIRKPSFTSIVEHFFELQVI